MLPFGKRKPTPETELEQDENAALEGERGNPNINEAVAPTKKLGRTLLLVFCGLLGLFLLYRYYDGIAERRAEREASQKKDTSRSLAESLPPLTVPAPPAPPSLPAAPPPAPAPRDAQQGPTPTYYSGGSGNKKKEPTAQELIAARKKSAPVTFAVGADIRAVQGGPDDERRMTSVDDTLSKNLVATATPRASAKVLGDRNYLLTKGTFIDAVLESAMDSSVPGMVAAIVSSDVFSANGRVVLLERGTKLTGEYKGSIQPGQSRLFVLWTRAETPKGVVINLDSPSTDALGRTGADGYIDNHWFQKLGAAILLSAWSDGLEILGNVVADKSNSNNLYTYDNTERAGEQMATETLRHTMSIPPTLYKNQGEPIRVFVARDLDFSKVYKIRPNFPETNDFHLLEVAQ